MCVFVMVISYIVLSLDGDKRNVFMSESAVKEAVLPT